MKPPAERVFVVDDEPAVRRSLWRLLRSEGFDVSDYGSADEFLRALPAEASGCAVLDLSMPGLDGLAVQEELSARGSGLAVVFLTGHGDIPKSVRAMKAGASDFLTKPVDGAALAAAVRSALARSRAAREAHAALAGLRDRLASLTPRERDVLEGVVAGQLNKQIASDLGIAEKTVKVHRGRVMEKMGAGSLAELVHLAERLGLARTDARRSAEEPTG
jgi:FixJ family two-component response regulator